MTLRDCLSSREGSKKLRVRILSLMQPALSELFRRTSPLSSLSSLRFISRPGLTQMFFEKDWVCPSGAVIVAWML